MEGMEERPGGMYQWRLPFSIQLVDVSTVPNALAPKNAVALRVIGSHSERKKQQIIITMPSYLLCGCAKVISEPVHAENSE